MRTRFTRAATGVALLAVLAVPALTSAPATAVDRTGTTLSIRTVKGAVAPGGSTAVTGVLLVKGAGGSAGHPVTLEARPTGTQGFVPVAETTTGEHGGVRVEVAPETTTRYRWHYAGDDTTRPSVSGIASVRVRTPQHPPTRLNTTLTIRAGQRVVAPDGQAAVRGRLAVRRVPVQHRFVVLLSRTEGAEAWAYGDVARTGPDGRVAFAVGPDERTAYRLVFLGTPLLQPVRSAVVRVAVRPTITIAADPAVVDPGGTTTVSGTVNTVAGPVTGASVELLARRVGSPQALEVVGTGTTGDDGTVAITAAPLRSQFYRLRVLRSEGVPRAISERVRVDVRFATSLSIRGRATPTSYAVSGVLRGHRETLRGREVALLAMAPGATEWTQVDSALTGVRGLVKFEQPLAAGTAYQLSFAGGPRLAPSTSGTVAQ
ncbi:MAG: hypothetical protein ABIO16_03475 [Nocardioides sp.]